MNTSPIIFSISDEQPDSKDISDKATSTSDETVEFPSPTLMQSRDCAVNVDTTDDPCQQKMTDQTQGGKYLVKKNSHSCQVCYIFYTLTLYTYLCPLVTTLSRFS